MTVFNDVNPVTIKQLKKAISEIPNISSLKYKPQFDSFAVGEEITDYLESNALIPSLVFIDPWGYKGLSLRLFDGAIKDWGSECIFFFNYNRINMGVSNPVLKDRLISLFGKDRSAKLSQELVDKSPVQREELIVNAMYEALTESYGNYAHSFRFWREDMHKVSHHLMHVTKNPLGYSLMKEIMAKCSTGTVHGVPTYEFDPLSYSGSPQLPLFNPIHNLANALIKDFKGRNLTMKEIYEYHHINKPFIKKNYKDALLYLEETKK